MKIPRSVGQKIAAILMVFSMVWPLMAVNIDTRVNAKPLTEEQKILHVLNRLGFGARPGDVEKVKAIGLQKYIDQQLNPSSIDDTVAENKIKGLDVFQMSTSELFAKYPNPGALIRQLDGGRNQAAVKNTADPLQKLQATRT
jgi:hypothetical protein